MRLLLVLPSYGEGQRRAMTMRDRTLHREQLGGIEMFTTWPLDCLSKGGGVSSEWSAVGLTMEQVGSRVSDQKLSW
jgi:hypothetical protein